MSPITVAVIGATGTVGMELTQTLLSSQYRPDQISRVVFFTRDTSSLNAKDLIRRGGEAIQVDGNALSATNLKGVDVLISTAGAMLDKKTKDDHAKVAAEAGVKVYFPPEYGIDIAPSSIRNPFFNQRMDHLEYAHKVGGDKMKVVVLRNGLFMSFLFTPFFGVDLQNHLITAWGNPDTKISTTSVPDIGRSIARLAVLAANDSNSVPDYVYISGDAQSYNHLADILGKEKGTPVKVVTEDWEEVKKRLDQSSDAAALIRLMYCEGIVDWSEKNHNEIVNPGGSLWKWTKVADYAKETIGKAA